MGHLFYVASFTVMLLVLTKLAGAQSIGICYANYQGQGINPLSATDVISLSQEHGFESMIMYEPDPDLIEAFKGKNVTLNLVIPNNHLKELSSNSDVAHRWAVTYITPFYKEVKFRYIAVGDEGIHGQNHDYDASLVHRAMLNVHKALTSFGLEKNIKVSTMASTKSLSWSATHPSQSAFSLGSAQADMATIVGMLAHNDAPLFVNLFPRFFYENQKGMMTCPYALMSNTYASVKDGKLEYHSLFDAMVDSMYAALEKVGAANVRVVAVTGWPMAGQSAAASVENAKTYTKNLMERVKSGVGTPMRPEWGMEVYLHSLIVQKYDGLEFGLFYPNKKAAYDI